MPAGRLVSLPRHVIHLIYCFVSGARDKAALACMLRDPRFNLQVPLEGWSFAESLQHARRIKKWRLWHSNDRQLLVEAISRYNRFLEGFTPVSKQRVLAAAFPTRAYRAEPNIPLIIHHIWLGSPVPAWVDANRQTWIDHHPGWDSRLWTDAEVEVLISESKLDNLTAYTAACNYGEKSDILRYELLLRYGGVYVDADMECVGPLDGLHWHSRVGLYVGLSNTGTVEANNGLLGAIPGHPILSVFIQRIKSCPAKPKTSVNDALASLSLASEGTRETTMQKGSAGGILAALLGDAEAQVAAEVLRSRKQPGEDEAMSTIERTGPGLVTRTLADCMLKSGDAYGDSRTERASASAEDVVILPPSWFYPVPNNANPNDEAVRRRVVRPGVTVAVHHWKRSWQTQPNK